MVYGMLRLGEGIDSEWIVLYIGSCDDMSSPTGISHVKAALAPLTRVGSTVSIDAEPKDKE